MTDLTPLPARICVVIRDGVPNSLHEFDLHSRSSKPIDDDRPGRTEHDVSVVDIVWALAATLRDQAEHLIKGTDAEDREDTRAKVGALLAWVDEGVAQP